jgi:hypothetical protein
MFGNRRHFRELPTARALLIRAAVDTAAFREVGDRLDGKPAQTTDVNIRHVKASQIGDDELADIALGRGEGIAEAAIPRL